MESRIIFLIWLYFTSVFSWETADHASDCELKLVQVVYRHGDRNIISTYPNDPYKNESFWPEGFGQLTKIGKVQQYELGMYLRKRYGGFLNDVYSPYEILVQTSNVDRTIMSAESNLAGLYPPNDNRSRWRDSINWQPIPVHNRPQAIDNILSLDAPCTRYSKVFDNFKYNSEVMRKFNEENADLYQLLSNASGSNVTGPKEVSYLLDALMIEGLYNFTLPDWAKEILAKYKQRLYDVAAFSFRMITYTDELKRLKGGPLLKELVENFKNQTDHSMDDRRKFFMYSGHDTTVATLLNTLGVFNDHCPPYTAMIMLELHRNITSDEYFVEIMYRNSTDEPYHLQIPGCGTPCMFDEFLNLTRDKIPVDWEKECEHFAPNYDTVGLVVGGLVSFLFLGLCVCLTMICIHMRNRRKGPSPPKYPYLHLQMEDGDEEA